MPIRVEQRDELLRGLEGITGSDEYRRLIEARVHQFRRPAAADELVEQIRGILDQLDRG